MGVLFKPPFKKFVKKQSRPFQLAIEDEVENILNDPDIGEVKKGNLSGFKVYKFNFKGQQFLIAYLLKQNNIIFYMIGTHENFYLRLKRYLKETEK
ncbi:MAG: type II toxin-antitoxin system RelE/ParE family toxin [Candidatus Scalinduaceae bacterium]